MYKIAHHSFSASKVMSSKDLIIMLFCQSNRCLIYIDIKQRKAANPHICKSGVTKWLVFYLINDLLIINNELVIIIGDYISVNRRIDKSTNYFITTNVH